MRPKPEEISCPKCPDQQPSIKRWLRGEYRPGTGGGGGVQIADIYEIACPACGKYELREPLPAK